MAEKKFKTIEEDGIVVFDGSDDYFPGEDIIDEEDELDIEYLVGATKQQEGRQSSERIKDLIVSCCVILGSVLYIAALCLIFY